MGDHPQARGRAPLHRLVWLRGDGDRVVFELERAVLLIGRDDDADVRIDEALVSRAHARLERRGAEYVLLDLGSTNLTMVNGERVDVRALRHGDELQFARARCIYETAEGDQVSGAGATSGRASR